MNRLGLVVFSLGVLLCARAAWDVAKFRAFQTNPQLVSAVRAAVPRFKGVKSPGLQVVGRVEVPRLRLSTLVVDGDDEQSLAFAAGHVDGTAALGANGNSAIAGHRDSAFRQLSGIRLGDLVNVAASGRTFQYVVTSTRIVSPDDLAVLSSANARVLTLITCYPFHYLGSAPQRFVVQARAAS